MEPSDTRLDVLRAPAFASTTELAARRPDAGATAARLRLHGVWCAGTTDGLARPCVAVVGSRAPSDAGRRLAERIARELGEAEVTIVSGLALGIDAAAHVGALSANAPTIGILGGGHRRFFPSRNLALAARIVANGGAVLSPYPPDAEARPFQFLQRNAVVAALVDAVLVVEAASRSGALSTASWASDFGVPVLAVPGDVDRAKAAGCNALIRDGATLVRHADDVLAAIGIAHATKRADASRKPPRARALLAELPYATELIAALEDGSRDAESLASSLDAPIGALVGTLVRLELLGVVARDGPLYSLI